MRQFEDHLVAEARPTNYGAFRYLTQRAGYNAPTLARPSKIKKEHKKAERVAVQAKPEAELSKKLEPKDRRIALVGGVMTLLFGVIFYLEPEKSLYSIIFWLSICYGSLLWMLYHLLRHRNPFSSETPGKQRSSAWGALAGGVFIVVSGYGYHVWEPPFSMLEEYITNGTAVYGTAFWNLDGKVVHPVGIAMYVRLENSKRTAEMIDQMSFEIKDNRGDWEPLIEINHGEFYNGGYPNLALLKVDLLDVALYQRNLQPGDFVSGWIFFDYPPSSWFPSPDFVEMGKHAVHPELVKAHVGFVLAGGQLDWNKISGFQPEFRAHVRDVRGQTFNVVMEKPSSRWSGQTILIAVENDPTDFSDHKIDFLRIQR